MTFVPYDRPIRAAFIGLGRIYDLNVRAYMRQPGRRGRCARRSRSASVAPNVKPIGPRHARSPRQPSSRRVTWRSMRPRSCFRSRSTPRGSVRCSATAGI